MNSPAYSTPQRLFLMKLKSLKEQLEERMEKDILPRLNDSRLPQSTKEDLKQALADLKKTIQEIDYLEKRLERL